MLVGVNDACRRHDPGRVHPDQPVRIQVLEDALARCDSVNWAQPVPATRSSIERVHDAAYLDELEAFCADGGGPWDPDTVASFGTWEASLASAGLARWAARTAVDTPPGPDTPFALGRPPGHHAVVDDAMGFCFVNNVAVAAEGVLAKGHADRVGIIDWDAHHANGTQQYVTGQPDAALVSLHQAGLYPGTGRLEATDTDRVVNVALPADLGDAEYRQAFDRTVVPAMEAFDPDVIVVSCGFDAHAKDVLASQRLSTDGFGLLASGVCELAESIDAGVGVVLEGGYALDVIGDCAVAMAEAFAGDIPPEPEYTTHRQLEAVLGEVERHPLVATA